MKKEEKIIFIGSDTELVHIEPPLVDFKKNNYIHWTILKGEYGTATSIIKLWYNLGKKVRWITITNEDIDNEGIYYFLNVMIKDVKL